MPSMAWGSSSAGSPAATDPEQATWPTPRPRRGGGASVNCRDIRYVDDVNPVAGERGREGGARGAQLTQTGGEMASGDHLAYDASPCSSKRRSGVSCWRPPETTRWRRVK